MIAVKTAPQEYQSMDSGSLQQYSQILLILLMEIIAVDIISIPINKIPKPAMISPKASSFLLLKNAIKTTPTKAIIGANAVISKAISCPVMVVPILAPIITHTAFVNCINPAFTNPTTMTVVAEDD